MQLSNYDDTCCLPSASRPVIGCFIKLNDQSTLACFFSFTSATELKYSRFLSPTQQPLALVEDDGTSMPSASPQYSYSVTDYGYTATDCFQDGAYDPFTQLTAMTAEQNFTSGYTRHPAPSYPASAHNSCQYSSSRDMDTSSDHATRSKACEKSYPGNSTDLFEDQDGFLSWTQKHPEHWNCREVMDWIFFLGQEQELDMSQLCAESFQGVTGTRLCSMAIDDFLQVDPKFGSLFYEMLQKLLIEGAFKKAPEVISQDIQELTSFTSVSCDVTDRTFPQCNSPVYTNLVRKQDQDYTDVCMKTELKEDLPCSLIDMAPYIDFEPSDTPQLLPNNNCGEFFHQEYIYGGSNAAFHASAHARNNYSYPAANFPQQLPRRRPGRPRVKSIPDDGSRSHKDKKVKNQHLWEFIYEALLNPMYNPLYLRWENQREGVFRFVQSEAVAQLWGSLKNNDNMTYEKLSRAMRHYYKRGILERVEGRRLVYKFSRKAIERVREKRNSV